jgi:hypothetical protein
MKPWLIHALLTGCALIGVTALAQSPDLRTGVLPSVGTMKTVPAFKLKPPPLVSMLVVEVKTGGDDFRPGSSITQQLVLADGRSEPTGNLRYYEIFDGSYGYSAYRQTLGISANETKRYFVPLPRSMTLAEVLAYRMKLTFDGAPRNAADSYDNWNIDEIRVFTVGICPGYPGTELAHVGWAQSQERTWQRMSGSNRTARVPMRVTGEAGYERITKLEAHFITGPDDLRGNAVATATVRLIDGTTYSPVNLNSGEAWGSGSRKTLDINLPVPTLVSSIDYVEIGFDGQGRDFGESYDNWDIQRIDISSMEACKAKPLFFQKGTPWWRTSAEDNEKTLYFRPN